MVLNLCLGPKGSNTTDQTPTPTRFIRNCEEVGLFQDLQNVNPFEETFRKAAEAVKTGQIPCMGSSTSFQCNPPDDTLHTPNIFPQITEVNSIACLNPVNPAVSVGQILEMTVAQESVRGAAPTITSLIDMQTPNSIMRLEESAKTDELTMMTTAEEKVIQTALLVKDKLQCSLKVKSMTELSKANIKALGRLENGNKVLIPKAAPNKSTKALAHKFSTFTKNLLKPVAHSSTSETRIMDVNIKKQKKRKGHFLQQESRSEYLARNRAAATRCRERKKMYMSYIEKLNRELSHTNQNLVQVNISLNEQLSNLKKELLRHKTCNMFNSNSQQVLDSAGDAVGKHIVGEKQIKQRQNSGKWPRHLNCHGQVEIENTAAMKRNGPNGDLNKHIAGNVDCVSKANMVGNVLEPVLHTFNMDEDIVDTSCAFDMVEVVLEEVAEEPDHVPIIDSIKSTTIIAHFGNSDDVLPPSPAWDSHNDMIGIGWMKIADEHSYSCKKHIVNKRFLKYNNIESGPSHSGESVPHFSEVRTLSTDSVVVNSQNLASLTLIKPFKKRKITSRQTLKS